MQPCVTFGTASKSRLKDIGYDKEVLGGIVLTDAGLQRLEIDRERVRAFDLDGCHGERVSAARLYTICKALNVSLSSMFGRDPTK